MLEPAALAEAGLSEGRHGLWLDEGSEVGAVLVPAGAFVGWLDVAWPHGHEPVPQLRGVEHVVAAHALEDALLRARRQLQRALRTCRMCRQRFVPGHMHCDEICQGCAERHLGVTH